MNNVLITGGAGFIGSTVAYKLANKGYNVTVFDNLSEQIHGKNADFNKNLLKKVKCIKGDIRNKKDLESAIIKQDAVIHLAAETGTGQSMYEIYKYTDVNIGGTSNLFELLVNKTDSVKKVLIASSRAVYGEGAYCCKEHGIVYPNMRLKENMEKGKFEPNCPVCGMSVLLCPTEESSKLNPTSIYGITKQVQEQIALTMGKALDIPTVIFRYQNVYGVGQSLLNPYTGILSIFSNRILLGKDINVFEDGLESRDFIYIDDVANATIAGLENKDIKYDIFNVGGGINVTVKEVLDHLQSCYGKTVSVNISGDYRIGDIRHNYADISKLKNQLNYTPKISFTIGVKKFAQWVLEEGITNDTYKESIDEMKKKGLLHVKDRE